MNNPARVSHCAVAVAIILLAAAATTVSGDVVWQNAYEGDVLPDSATPPWSHGSSAAGQVSIVDSDYLAFDTSRGTFDFYNIGPSAWDGSSSTGSTVELRLSVDALDGAATDATRFSFGNSARAWEVFFEAGAIRFGAALLTPNRFLVSPGFHTYRFLMDNGAGTGSDLNTVDLYVDDVLALSDVTATIGGQNQLYMGDLDFDTGGESRWDYVRWTHEGQFVPIPEPAAAGMLLAAVGYFTFARRGRARRLVDAIRPA